jgi:hypothetical protein
MIDNNLRKQIGEILMQQTKFMGISIDSLFFFEHIPPKRLRNAIKSFAPISPDETPICLFDETLLGSGKGGFLLTTHRLYMKCTLERAFSASIDEIVAITHKHNAMSSQLTITTNFNSYNLIITQVLGKQGKDTLFNVLNNTVQLLKNQNQPSQQSNPPVSNIVTATVLVCPSCGAQCDGSLESQCRFCDAKFY